jgi:flagellar biosynthesis protein FlhA
VGWCGYRLQRQRQTPPPPPPSAPKPTENMADLLTVDPLEVELGYGLVSLADPKQGGDLLERITAVRRQVATELGFLVPPIRVRDNVRLRGNQYSVRLRGLEIGSAELHPNHLLAMDAGAVSQPISGIPAEDPAFGLPAVWVPAGQRTLAEVSGYTVVDPTNVLVTHLSELVRRHAPEVLTRQDLQVLLDTVKQQSPAVVEELIPGLLTLGQLQKVLQLLLRERVAIRDLASILEALADAAALTRDPEQLAEFVRQRLARHLTRQYLEGDGRLYCFTLHPAVEQAIAESIQRTDAGMHLALELTTQQQILEAIRWQAERLVATGHQPLALCAPRVRQAVRQLCQSGLSTLVVLSYNEVTPGVAVEALGMVTRIDENPAL